MSQVKRYDCTIDDYGSPIMEEEEHGDYVKFTGHEAVVQGLWEEIERLQKENQFLIEAFANYPTWTGQKLALARNPDVARSVS